MAGFKLKKGFDINIAGKARQNLVQISAPKKVAIQPTDFRGIKAKLDVEVGTMVKRGSVLFHSKDNENLKFVSPVSGKVAEINRGDRRVLTEIVVENDTKNETVKFQSMNADAISKASPEQLIKNMLEGGMWPVIRQRPFSKIANPADKPRDIFISAMDTAPLAADVNFIMQGLENDFQSGVNILAKLTEGKVYLSIDGKSDFFKNIQNVELNTFSGPHPAGNVGVHIHHIKPIKQHEVIWYTEPYFVAMIGAFFRTGEFPAERIIAVAGPVLKETNYFKTILGVPVTSLVPEGNLTYGDVRFISGNVLTGKKVLAKGYAGFYNNLLSVVAEGAKEKKLFGWYLPGLKKRSHSRTFLSSWIGPKEYEIDTLLNGASRAFIMTGDYEEVLPMDIYPVYLAKSILADDIEEMEGLGILEVDEEDVALCSYICPSKYDFGAIVRKGLDLIEKEG